MAARAASLAAELRENGGERRRARGVSADGDDVNGEFFLEFGYLEESDIFFIFFARVVVEDEEEESADTSFETSETPSDTDDSGSVTEEIMAYCNNNNHFSSKHQQQEEEEQNDDNNSSKFRLSPKSDSYIPEASREEIVVGDSIEE